MNDREEKCRYYCAHLKPGIGESDKLVAVVAAVAVAAAVAVVAVDGSDNEDYEDDEDVIRLIHKDYSRQEQYNWCCSYWNLQDKSSLDKGCC